MITEKQLQKFKHDAIEFINSITKEEFHEAEITYGYDEMGFVGVLQENPNGLRTLTITILRPNRPETDPKNPTHYA